MIVIMELSTAVAFDVFAYYPHSIQSLYLRGDACGLNWNSGIQMEPFANRQDAWVASVDCPLDTQALEVKVLIGDKTWMLGSNHHAVAGSGSTEIYPWFYTYQGTLQIIKDVSSQELNNTRDVIYYLPPSYKENTLKVHSNVLVMHDGQNLFQPSTAFAGNPWYCQNSLDSTIINGATDEVLIVGAYNTADRINEYTYVYDPSEGTGGKGDLYLDWIESTLLPLTAESFRVSIQRDSLGILGSSLGGLISCYAAWTRPQIYGKTGCMSSSFWWDDNDFQTRIVPRSTPPSPVPKIYMDSGTGSPGEIECTGYTLNIYNQMLADGFEENVDVFRYVDQGATHSETYWGPRFHVPMEMLYPAADV